MHMRLEKCGLQPSHKLNMIMMAHVLSCGDGGRGWRRDPEKLGVGGGGMERSLMEEQSLSEQRRNDKVLKAGARRCGGGSGVVCKGNGEPRESYKSGRLGVPDAERNVDYGGRLAQGERGGLVRPRQE